MIRFFYILFFSMFFITVKAQKTAVLLREANFYFSQADYYAAAHFYEEAFQKIAVMSSYGGKWHKPIASLISTT